MNSKKLGYVYVLLAITIFAGRDGFSKLLAEKYPPILVTMIRFWAGWRPMSSQQSPRLWTV
ncbi:hypothetical protein J5277_17895 [Rhizobium sp. 16-449-1b]|nr:hypothetical protein [Rhizobium sp. 16-449-1b]